MDQAPGQKWMAVLISLHTAIKYIVPLVLGIAALKYQGKETGLFDENPAPAWCFLAATWVFILMVGTLKQMPPSLDGIWFHILVRSSLACGLVSIVCAVSIFLPHGYSSLPFITLAPLLVVLAWPILQPAYNWAINHAKNVFDSISAKIAYIANGSNFAQEASIPK